MKKKLIYFVLFVVIIGFTQAINFDETIKNFHENVRKKWEAELVKIEIWLDTMIDTYQQKWDSSNLDLTKKMQEKVKKNEWLRKKHAQINWLLMSTKTIDKNKTPKQVRLDIIKTYQSILDIYSSWSESIKDNFHAWIDTSNFHSNKYQLFKELYENSSITNEKIEYEKNQIQELSNAILDLQKSIELFYINPDEYSSTSTSVWRMLHVNQYKNYMQLAELQKDNSKKSEYYQLALSFYQKATTYFDPDCDETCKRLDENIIKNLKK